MLEYEELRPGLYSINFSADIPVERLEITDIPWLDAVVARIARFERPAAHLEAAQLATQPLYDGAPEVTAATEGVLRVLRRAVEARCLCTDSRPGSTPSTEGATGDDGHPPARVMILFSGGLDSSLLAALANEALPPEEPIDLVSICFAGGTSPDRLAALDAVAELRAMAPGRLWRLLAADRSLEDAVQVKEHLLRLLAPSDTVMDFNIGAALWLAAEGSGYIVPAGHAGRAAASETACNGQQNLEKEALQEPEKVMYRSAARVVLLGHGADELFGGYGRHRTRFREGSWQGLSDELALDVRRLWVRNLGRDDRLIADRGKEARHPFLDEAVILESLSHPLHALVDLRSAPGEGDKRVLRECLRQLGMPRAAQRVKRAIQFGSRLAKASNAAQFGGTKRANAKNAGSVRLGEAGAES